MEKQRIVLGISGASGFQYGHQALQMLQDMDDIETHRVISKGAEITREEIVAMADVVHPIQNLGASISSGSFKTIGMLVAPCSMRSLAAIANGMSDNLLTRAADVVLKDRRRLVLMVRETPLNLAHLDNMRKVTEMGGVIFPPVPAFYQKPQTIDEILTHSIGRALDMFGIHVQKLPRWGDEGIEN